MAKINFQGKGDIYSHHLTIPHHELVADKDKSILNDSADENLIIHGDNLLALKSLMPKYEGKIKCIYIDPPYNTDNDKWVYNDKVNSPALKEWLGKLVDSEDQSRHDKWLCMMWSRLHLLRDLLAEDGVIFISIDDNEQYRLRAIMDEIFGEENFVDMFIIRSNPRGNQAKKITAPDHEYVVSYAKDKKLVKPYSFAKSEDDFNEKDEETGEKYKEIGLRKRGAGSKREDAEGEFFPIYYNPDTNDISISSHKSNYIKILPYLSNGEEGRWRWSKDTVESNKEKLLARPVKRKNGNKEYDVFEKEYFYEGRRTKVKSIIYEKWANYENATESLELIFEKEKVFEFSKPVDLIKYFIEATCSEGIILDSFAGSGTTAEAVLRLNKEYKNENLKFILIQHNEWDKEKEKEINICDEITAERVRRVIKGVPKAKDEDLIKKGLGGGFIYYDVGRAIKFDEIILGKNMPTYKQLAELLFFQVTAEALGKFTVDEKTWFVGETDKYRVHLIYKDDMEFLHKEGNLRYDTLQAMANKLKKGQKLFIFASGRYVDFDHLKENNAIFSYIPHEIHRELS